MVVKDRVAHILSYLIWLGLRKKNKQEEKKKKKKTP
jgi:hypothetical protein